MEHGIESFCGARGQQIGANLPDVGGSYFTAEAAISEDGPLD
jgi:hypothetical protein